MALASAIGFLSPWIDGIYLATYVIFLERHCRGLPFQWTVYINMSLKTCLIAFAVLMPVMNLRSFSAALDLLDTSVLAWVWNCMEVGTHVVWRGLWDVPLFCCQFPSVRGGFINHRKCRNKESSPIGVLIWILTFSFFNIYTVEVFG